MHTSDEIQTDANTICWINGKLQRHISVSNRGLRYGDGLFETMAVRDGQVLLEASHLERLTDGCRQLGMTPPSRELLRQEFADAARGQSAAVLNLQLIRDGSDRGYRPEPHATATRILCRDPWPVYPDAWSEHGVRVRICEAHWGHNRRLAGLKHLNRLEQVLAQSEWSDADDIQEGLMLDEEGSVVGGTMSNVFAWLSHGVLATPMLRRAGVAGVMRRYLLGCAGRAAIQVRIATLSLSELMKADEIFLCNSLIGVWPVHAIGHWSYRVGEMTRRAQNWAAARS